MTGQETTGEGVIKEYPKTTYWLEGRQVRAAGNLILTNRRLVFLNVIVPSPEQMARQSRTGWVRAAVEERGKVVERLLLSRPVLWYAVCPDRRVLLVIVRDPTGKQRDDFFFTTDIEASAAAVVEHYAGR